MALFSSISSRDNVLFLLAGMRTAIVIAASIISIVLFFGTILSLVCDYNCGILEKLSAIYIETFCNTLLVPWISVIRFLVPIPVFRSGVLSISIFTTAIIAEVVRSGLNSINKGQSKAACSQSFGFFQTLRFIIIPQCFKDVVPSLLSQMIATVKDTSFPWAVVTEEFTGKGMILTSRSASSTQVFILFALMVGVYFIINFALSNIVRRQNTEGQSLKKSALVGA